MKTKYILVEWPESQKWIDHPDCILAAENDRLQEVFEPRYFVPENIYNTKSKLPISNNKYEIWAVDKDGFTIAEFNSFKEADDFNKDYFQILYKNIRTSPVHVYKQNKL